MSLLGWSLFADEFHGQNYRYRYRLDIDIDIDTDMILLEFKVIFPIQIQDYGIFYLLTSIVFHLYLLSSTLKIPVLKDTGNDEIRNSHNYLLVFSYIIYITISK